MGQARYEFDLTGYRAGVFDLDGVVTDTAGLHARAWARLFDEYLRARDGAAMRAFDPIHDYLAYVDGKPRYEGVRSFLSSRGITLAEGAPSDAPAQATISGLGNKKSELFNAMLELEGIALFDTTLSFIRQIRSAGLKSALVTSSENGARILERAGISELFDARVDGVDSMRMQLKGKPDPDIFLAALDILGISPGDAFAVEDALSGVQSAKAAGYAKVVGIDRSATLREAMVESGADCVVADLGEIRITGVATTS